MSMSSPTALRAAPRFARIDASTSTAVIKRFGVKSFPELLLFNASQATFRRYRGDFTAEALRALANLMVEPSWVELALANEGVVRLCEAMAAHAEVERKL